MAADDPIKLTLISPLLSVSTPELAKAMASSRCSSSPQLVFLFLLFSSFVLQSAVGADPDTEERINTLCHQVEEFGFCNQTFHQNLKGPTVNYVGLTQIANVQANIFVTKSLALIRQLKQSTTDPGMRVALQTCENGYNVVQQALRDGINYFFKGDYNGMLNAERIAPRAQASCDSIFATPPQKQSPLVETNREMRILIAMALISGHHIAS